MPRTRQKLSLKLDGYAREFGAVLSRAGNVLFCNACQKPIAKAERSKYYVEHHFETRAHRQSLALFASGQHLALARFTRLDEEAERVHERLQAYARHWASVLSVEANAMFCAACDQHILHSDRDNAYIDEHVRSERHVSATVRFVQQQTQFPVAAAADDDRAVSARQTLSAIRARVTALLPSLDGDASDDRQQLLALFEACEQLIGPNTATPFISYETPVSDQNSNEGENSVDRHNDDHKPEQHNSTETQLKPKEQKNTLKARALKARAKSKTATRRGRRPYRNANAAAEPLVCLWPGCDKSYKLRSHLTTHMKTHTGEKKYKCNFGDCDKAYERKLNFMLHLRRHKCLQFTLEKKFKCEWPECDKVFPFKNQMKRHVEMNHIKMIRFRCEWPGCADGFVNKSQYESHYGRAHLGEALYKCDHCDKRFTVRTNLIKHNSEIHLKQKKYACEYADCGESFTRKEQLLKHEVEAHDHEEKLLFCDWPGCEYRTVAERNLKCHRNRHTNERPFKCSWPSCDWSFRQSDHLKAHMMTHTGEKPVECDDSACGLRFQTKRSMRSHFEKTHRNDATPTLDISQ